MHWWQISVSELLVHSCQCQIDESHDVVVYDQQSAHLAAVPEDCFVSILLAKLSLVFSSVSLLKGGFLEFQSAYPSLCENKSAKGANTLTSLSQPCMPISAHGPTRILPFLYLGSQQDALNKDTLRVNKRLSKFQISYWALIPTLDPLWPFLALFSYYSNLAQLVISLIQCLLQLKDHNINYELNVSTSCPKPEFIPDSHFLRIAVNDNYNENLLPYFPKAFSFLGLFANRLSFD